MARWKSILFVCLGNICRSPTGEAVMRKILSERGLDGSVRVESAGTGPWHVGEPADPRMRAAAARRGYDLNGVGRQVEREDFDRFDLIVAMDRSNLEDLRLMDAEGRYESKLRLLCDFLTDSELQDVPDPYYGGPRGFDHVLDLIEEASENLADRIDLVAHPEDKI
jgi:protein-tyrosine phosphatase